MDRIKIQNLEVFGHHGVFSEETKLGQKFLVNATMYTNTRAAGYSDDLEKSINYGEVCHFITGYMQNHTFKLIEAVAEHMAQAMLMEYPLLQKLDLEIRKPWAPIGLPLENVSVEISRGWHTVYLSAGSNLGERQQFLRAAVRLLQECSEIRNLKVSKLMETAPYGYTEQLAVSLYGCYQKAITIYNLPSAFMVSLTACIVPAVSAALTRKDKLGAGKIAESALRVGALLALPAGVGLAVLSGPIIQMLYPETNQEVASHCLLVLGIASAFVCMMLLCNAILQANGRAALPIWFIAIGSATKLAVNFVLVQIPSVGIKGAPMGTLVCFALVSVMELVAIKKVTPHPPKYLRVFVKPAIAAGVMGAAVWASYGLLAAHLGNTLSVAGSIVIGCVVYGILVLVLRIVSRDDLSLMPKGDKIAKLLRIR